MPLDSVDLASIERLFESKLDELLDRMVDDFDDDDAKDCVRHSLVVDVQDDWHSAKRNDTMMKEFEKMQKELAAPVDACFPEVATLHDVLSILSPVSGMLPVVVPEGNEKCVVHMQLLTCAQMNVFQRENYMDVDIKTEPQAGLYGVCGNFNGDIGDDTTHAILKRIGHLVHRNEDLSSGLATVVLPSAKLFIDGSVT